MNAAILIAGRELRDRSRLFLVATVLAVIPFIASLTLRDQRQTGMAMTATFLAVGYAAVVALMLGISTIGRELSENRGSFLFTRPVSPAAIWFGKTVAAVVICLGAFFIVALPTYTLARDAWRDLWGRGALGALYAVILCVALFFGGHVASTMLRSRSSRLLLDIVFLVLAVVALIAMLRPVLAVGGGNVVMKVAIGIGVALLAVFLAAPVVQLARGRIDPLRNHVTLSTVLWVAVAIILVVAAAYVQWVRSPPLASVTETYALDQSPTGEWVFVAGTAPGRGSLMTSYLINSKSGRRERLTLPLMTALQFSRDGKIAAWLENEALLPRFTASDGGLRDFVDAAAAAYGTGSYRLYTRRLESGAKHMATRIVVPLPRNIQLSPDGSRVTLDMNTYDVATGQTVPAALTVSPSAPVHPQGMVVGEVGDSRLLILTRDRRSLRIVDRATGSVHVEMTGVSTPIVGRSPAILPRYTEDATFVAISRSPRYVLWDAKTGAKRPFPS